MSSLPEQPPVKKATRSEKWMVLAMFLGLSTLSIGLTASGKFASESTNWIFVCGAVFFPVLTIVAVVDLIKDRSIEESDRAVQRTVGWLIGGPILAFIGLWAATSVFGWFSSIPSWAAVIIVLLIILVLR